jgi:hypothetical protein
MGFEIDTGFEPRRPVDFVDDWFRDLHPSDAADVDVMRGFAQHVMGEMRNPAKFETVRRHFLMRWSFVRAVADLDPALFDEILAAYAERWLEARE